MTSKASAMDMDPTMPAQQTGKSEEFDKEALIEFYIRDIEERNLDRKTFNPLPQVWNKKQKECDYGQPGSAKRKFLSSWTSNNLKRWTWSRYVGYLDRKGIDMSETTETKLAQEMEKTGGEERDAFVMDPPAPAPVVSFNLQPVQNATLISSASSHDPVAMLTDQFATATKISSTQSPAVAAPTTLNMTSPFRSPGSVSQGFASPAIQHRLSFEETAAFQGHNVTFQQELNYVGNGASNTPLLHFYNEQLPYHHGPAYVHNTSIEEAGKDYVTTVVQCSGPVGEINGISLEVATWLPQGLGLQKYLGRALLLKVPLVNIWAKQYETYGKSQTQEEAVKKSDTVKTMKKALANGETHAHHLIIFPMEQDPFDNRVFSSNDTMVKRETIPNTVQDKMSGVQMYGYTSTWKIAHAGTSSVLEMRDDNMVDTSNFYKTA